MEKRYVVGIELSDGERYPSTGTAEEIVRRIDMMDCSGEELEVYDISRGGCEQLEIHGCWHNPKDPLYIKVTDKNGNVVFDGYGTDH